MALQGPISRITALSTDADPFPSGSSIAAGSLLWHTDTRKKYEYNGNGWEIFGLSYANRKSAFGELLVSQLSPQFQGSFEFSVSNTDLNTNTITNGGTVTQAQAMSLTGTSTTTNSTALLQSKQHARYKSGLGGEVRFTALFTTPIANTEQLIGLADATGSNVAFKNGFMIGYVGTVFGFHVFKNDTIETIPLSSWDDPMDGTGLSGIVIDTTKLNIFFIPFQYLGAGLIEIFMESPSTGIPTSMHRHQYANLNTTPSVYNPNFFFTIFANNKATTADLIVKSASYGYFIHGKTEYIELHQPAHSIGQKTKSLVTLETAIFTVRNKTTYAGKQNFIDIVILHISASSEASSANNLAAIHMVKNTTLGGTPVWNDLNASNSVIEVDTAGTTVTGGDELPGFPLAGKNDKVFDDVSTLKIILNPGDTITMAGSSNNSATITADCYIKELF